ncbi:MAG: GDYXXLXY domain-containing protein [Bacteroidia bacterium]|nr:GDYXXLXY domain-containing protein [Bacteroidia bacterium]NNC85175.1 GDYXXLXY domain-containing protein [Bacteroidia bacterium]NNM16895.1 GDYXXLXY domain-containing protein [Bacteroidia bacterium]
MTKKILLPAFVLVALAQLYVPAKMILDREDIMDTGTEYKFKTEPIDPTDPFRGKYITLRYEDDIIKIQNEEDWVRGETIYVFFTTDDEGFAKIDSVSTEHSTDNRDFLKTKVRNITSNSSNKLTIDFPFNRYYMEESKAYDAELAYRDSQIDTNQTAYALVNIKDGEAVLKDVLIDGVSIREIVIMEREKQE